MSSANGFIQNYLSKDSKEKLEALTKSLKLDEVEYLIGAVKEKIEQDYLLYAQQSPEIEHLINLSINLGQPYTLQPTNPIWDTIKDHQVNILANILEAKKFKDLTTRETTSLKKILCSYITVYERFPFKQEIDFIIQARKTHKNITQPSNIKEALQKAKNEGFLKGFCEDFIYYLRQVSLEKVKAYNPNVQPASPVQNTKDDFSEFL